MQEFSLHLTHNILALHKELEDRTYRHGGYTAFHINDPKPRDIHKATVRDRLLHHAIYRILYPYFDTKFIFDSYSCRRDKGTHRATDRFREYARKVSQNHTRTAWVLKCDIRKFFANIDHGILIGILKRHLHDDETIQLLGTVIESFHTDGRPGVGLPLGNLTSQLLVNVYMNEFDQYVKRVLKAKYYVRYADDFVLFHENKSYLEEMLPEVSAFLGEKLHLALHPNKVFIKTVASGVDFLGWVHFPHHRVLRRSTKRRMERNLYTNAKPSALASYQGMLSHGDTYKLREKSLSQFLEIPK